MNKTAQAAPEKVAGKLKCAWCGCSFKPKLRFQTTCEKNDCSIMGLISSITVSTDFMKELLHGRTKE